MRLAVAALLAFVPLTSASAQSCADRQMIVHALNHVAKECPGLSLSPAGSKLRHESQIELAKDPEFGPACELAGRQALLRTIATDRMKAAAEARNTQVFGQEMCVQSEAFLNGIAANLGGSQLVARRQ